MRVLLAVVILALICAPTVWANGTKVTPPVQPEVVPPGAGPITPSCPPCPPLPSAISAGTTSFPMIVPVLVNKSLINTVPCVPNVSVLVPTTVDCTMATKILGCSNLAVVMVPVTVPAVASQSVTGRMLSGAGPCPISIDQSQVSQMLNSGQSIVILPLVAPVSFDQNMFNMAQSGQAIQMQQSSFAKIAPAGQPVMVVPMAVPSPVPGTTLSGRGPALFVPLTKDAEQRVLSTGSVWVATQMDRPTLNSMIASNSVQMVVPMMVPITVAAPTPSATVPSTTPSPTE